MVRVVVGGRSAQGRREWRFDVVEVVSLQRDAQVVCVDAAASVDVYGLVGGVDVEQHRCQYTSLWLSVSLSSPTDLLPVQHLDDTQSVDCDCGEPQTMAHLLSCRLLDEASTADHLATVTDRAGKGMRPQVGENCLKDTTEEEDHCLG